MLANDLDEHQLAQLGEHALAASALFGRFHHRHTNELMNYLTKQARVAVMRAARLNDWRQIVKEGIERLGVAGKEPAYEPARRSISVKVDEERQLASAGHSVMGIRCVGISPHAWTAR